MHFEHWPPPPHSPSFVRSPPGIFFSEDRPIMQPPDAGGEYIFGHLFSGGNSCVVFRGIIQLDIIPRRKIRSEKNLCLLHAFFHGNS